MNLQNLLVGIAFVVVVFPFITKALQNGHLDLNGLTLDLTESTLEAITRRDWNFGDPTRQDYVTPDGQED
jgi:hypothetical protein